MFAAKGFTAQELVVLSDAHTLGFAHCNEFTDRIFGRAKGGAAAAPHDPAMNLAAAAWAYSARTQELWTDPRTRLAVQRYAANQTDFFADLFTIVKLGVQGVKTGRDGEVRRRCDMFNGNPIPRG
ncbi:hypothetical protein BAE44_0007502 [Dichanthelium oligosanthes]|uniref:Plant heme peroxidase family profile domain-containing protein n=1 Tax=Dichanthelium oligosanthes TaxID=888268 RepID=A0A1E5W293_9POAL|nr:hypothetical protein BAE44_0007502 [Dichanthelium oligosanthes]